MSLLEDHKRRETLEERLTRIREAAQQAHSVEELCQQTGYQPKTLQSYTMSYKIPLLFPRSKFYAARPIARRPEIDRLIEQGKMLKEIGQDEQVNLSRERVRQYILQTGQYDDWKEKKLEGKGKTTAQLQTRGEFCSLLEARADQLAEQRGWAYQKAWEYRSSLMVQPKGKIPFKSLLTLFRRYEKAKEKGEKRSLEELAEGLFYASDAGRILRRVDLEPMYGIRDRHQVHYETKLAINRAARRLPRISHPDIAYFLDFPLYVVQQHPAMRARKRGRGSGAKRIIKIFGRGFGKGTDYLTYRLASQIYESKAAGFNQLETAELLDTTTRIVQYALQHKREIAPVIMRTLRVLYPYEKVKRPYRAQK